MVAKCRSCVVIGKNTVHFSSAEWENGDLCSLPAAPSSARSCEVRSKTGSHPYGYAGWLHPAGTQRRRMLRFPSLRGVAGSCEVRSKAKPSSVPAWIASGCALRDDGRDNMNCTPGKTPDGICVISVAPNPADHFDRVWLSG
jgi:hypothetical protein